MIDRDLQHLVEISKKDHTLEFYLSLTRGRSVERKDGKLFLVEDYQDLALTVRTISCKEEKKGRLFGKAGLSLTLSLAQDAVEQAISRAKALAEYGKDVILPDLPLNYPEVKIIPAKFLTHEEMQEWLDSAKESLGEFPKIIRVEKENFAIEEEQIFLIKEGKILSFRSPTYSYSVSVISENGRSAQAYAYNSTRELERLDARKLFRKAYKMASALAKAKKRETIRCAVLFPPDTAIILLDLLSFSFLGDEVEKGRSKLRDKLGKKVFSEEITIIDDGLLEFLPEGRPFDDEGIPQERTILVEKGTVKNYLLDSLSADHLGLASNGKARRLTLGQNPRPQPTNLYIEKGSQTKEKLLQAENYVFEVFEVLGAHTADPVSGEFSFGVSGVLYYKGEIVDYLSEMALTGNIFEVFERDILLGEDLVLYDNLGAPSILIPEMTLG